MYPIPQLKVLLYNFVKKHWGCRCSFMFTHFSTQTTQRSVHINMFPTIESHYTRGKSKRKYLDSDLSVSQMHCLYVAWMNDKKLQEVIEGSKDEKGTVIASERMYRDIFNQEFNLGFFQPKSDQCDVCNTFKAANQKQKTEMQLKFDDH